MKFNALKQIPPTPPPASFHLSHSSSASFSFSSTPPHPPPPTAFLLQHVRGRFRRRQGQRFRVRSIDGCYFVFFRARIFRLLPLLARGAAPRSPQIRAQNGLYRHRLVAMATGELQVGWCGEGEGLGRKGEEGGGRKGEDGKGERKGRRKG